MDETALIEFLFGWSITSLHTAQLHMHKPMAACNLTSTVNGANYELIEFQISFCVTGKEKWDIFLLLIIHIISNFSVIIHIVIVIAVIIIHIYCIYNP